MRAERLFESAGSPYCKNGEGWSDGAQGSRSGHVQKCERPGASRGRSPADQMPRVHRKALGVADGGLGGGTPRRQGEPVGRNRAPGPGEVDSEGVEEGLRLWKRRRRYGIPDRPVYRRDFSGRVNPKDGYTVADCKDPRVKRVLEFLVPLLYPEKSMRVTITIGNTIFGALSGERPVDWGIVVRDLVQRLLSGMGKSKATPICPYVFHLYHSHELLLPAEKKEYRIQEALVKHNVESEEDEDPTSPANPDEEESSDDSNKCESLTPSEIKEIQKQEAARLKESPMNKKKQLPASKDPVSSKRKSLAPVDAAERSYQTIATACREIRAREREREALIQEVCKRLGNVRPDGLVEAIDHLPSQKRMEELEAKISFL